MTARPRRRRSTIFALLMATVLTSACGNDATPEGLGEARPTAAARSTSSIVGKPPIQESTTAALIRRHLVAVCASDIDGWSSALSPNVRFDIAGSIYQGKNNAIAWALRDPIGQHGCYDIVSLTPTTDGIVADVTFRAGTLVEQIRYSYRINNGQIVDLIARYR